MYKDPFASCDLQKENRESFRQNPNGAQEDRGNGESLLRDATRVLPITVPDKRDRLTVVRAPVYTRRSEDALRLTVQPRRTSLFHHHILRLDGEVQASCVDCKQKIKKD